MSSLVNFLSQILQFFYQVTTSLGIPNYGIAIIVFTIVIKAILFPLTYRSGVAMRRVQLLAPMVQEIQAKHKGNPQKSQQAVMELYKKYNANPLGGCLPLLIQMPILFSLFTAMRQFFDPNINPDINLEHAGFLWIGSLGDQDPYFMPIMVGVATFLQQWVTTAGTTGNQQTQSTMKTMLYVMPVFMGWISRGFPSGLALYWVMYSLVSMVEQYLVKRRTVAIKEEVGAK